MSQFTLSEFADKIGEIMPTVIKEFLKRQTAEIWRGKITMPQFLILNFLCEKNESPMKDLAHFMGVTKAATTGLVDRLVKYGYAERVPHSSDRRIIKIKATRKGITLAKKINSERHGMIIDIFGKLPQGEREDYLKILTHIKGILAEAKNEKT